jgi:hypothetical protein
MWLFTPKGFISVVADKQDPTGPRLLVRARSLSHLQEVLQDYLDNPFQVKQSDYAWRAWIKRKDLQSVVEQVMSDINYTNFKNSITDNEYHDACLDVWTAMYTYQKSVSQ